MPDFLNFVSMMREQMNATLLRSDVLRALIWPLGILMLATLGLVHAGAPHWLLVVFSVLFVLCALLYGASYVFCLINDRDSLRSEKYSLTQDKVAPHLGNTPQSSYLHPQMHQVSHQGLRS
jgi:hypothetical protein